MEWSQTRYNLIVQGSAGAPLFRNNTGTASFRVDRMFGGTEDELISRYENDMAGLSEMLALIVPELYPREGPQPAFVSRIDQVEKRGGRIHFQFEHLLDGLTAEEVFRCGYFDIDLEGQINESNRTHWAIKKGNLIEGIFKLIRDQPKDQSPKAFNVGQWPLPVLGHVAVMMPFAGEFDAVYLAVKSACGSIRLDTLRVDEIYSPTPIINDVFKTIEQSRLVISDLSGRNPNVLYETGLAHARNRDVIMIVQNNDDVPFDLRHIRYIRYLPNQEGLQKLVADLKETISTTLN